MKAYSLFVVSAAVITLLSCGTQDQTAVGLNDNISKDSIALADTSNYAAIQWIDSTDLNLGKVTEGQVVDVRWRFKNVGTKPLIITAVQPGCGCTASEPPKEPIAPGKESVIEAKFNSKGQYEGQHTKAVKVIANTNPNISNLNFSVEVAKQ